MKRVIITWALAVLAGSAGCGAGVPVQLRLDEIAFDLSLDDSVSDLSGQLGGSGLVPALSSLPERWPAELPEVCFDFVIATDPKDGGQIDLTPDPAKDPEAAQLFAPVNDGTVERIELDRLILRVEENTLNLPLPPVEIQGADAIDADPEDRKSWFTLGAIGGAGLSPGCPAPGAALTAPVQALGAGALGDLELTFVRGGESFLDNQLADEDCLARQKDAGEAADPLACKELAIRARSRLVFDTKLTKDRPRGSARIRVILVATFYIQAL